MIFLAMGVVATHRWAVGFLYLVWFALLGAVLNIPMLATTVQKVDPDSRPFALESHPLTDPKVVALGRGAGREGSSPESADPARQYIDVHCGTKWEELDRGCRYFRTVDPPLAGRAELLARQHAPALPYARPRPGDALHALRHRVRQSIEDADKKIAAEVAESRQRYVVSDLAANDVGQARGRTRPGPPATRSGSRRGSRHEGDKFPWNQPVVLRSGRYVVHRDREACSG